MDRLRLTDRICTVLHSGVMIDIGGQVYAERKAHEIIDDSTDAVECLEDGIYIRLHGVLSNGGKETPIRRWIFAYNCVRTVVEHAVERMNDSEVVSLGMDLTVAIAFTKDATMATCLREGRRMEEIPMTIIGQHPDAVNLAHA